MQFEQLKRREFIALLGGAAATWPIAARAQQAGIPLRIGFLPIGSPSNAYDRSLVQAFRDGLLEAGLVENRDVFLDLKWVNSEPELPKAIDELIRRGANLLVPCGTSASVAAKAQAAALPILFINVGNPIGVGLVDSLSRPGGNVTGFSDMHADLSGKYVQFATELDKSQATVNYLWYTEWADGRYRLQVSERAAQSLGVRLQSRGMADISETDDAMAALKGDRASTVIVQSSPFTFRNRIRLIDSALSHGLAPIYAFPPGANDGALLAYGPDYAVLYRRAASYVERLLKGAKPADLPVEQPTAFQLIINLKTAKALGLDVPWILQQRADQVIE
jgi:putative ABC transport system substrate-binding protein